jgi:RNA polymerase sigma-B factor
MSVSAPPRPPRISTQPHPTTDDQRSKDELVTSLLPLAKRLAARYRHAGESQDDLEQVACLGLVKAVDRYDPSAGPLVRYAVPTILGELRRHFRDKGWGVHVPRSVQENLMTVNKAVERLTTTLGRTPTAKDIAKVTTLSVEDVIEALDAGASYTPAALDAPRTGGDPESRSLGDSLGSEDPNYALVELGEAIGPAFQELPSREQAIVQLRFFEDLTQAEIAERVGISQMHVSRLLRRALDTLHGAVAA